MFLKIRKRIFFLGSIVLFLKAGALFGAAAWAGRIPDEFFAPFDTQRGIFLEHERFPLTVKTEHDGDTSFQFYIPFSENYPETHFFKMFRNSPILDLLISYEKNEHSMSVELFENNSTRFELELNGVPDLARRSEKRATQGLGQLVFCNAIQRLLHYQVARPDTLLTLYATNGGGDIEKLVRYYEGKLGFRVVEWSYENTIALMEVPIQGAIQACRRANFRFY